jgi:asparagine synthase (glutamine-hydrolysing)
MAHSLEVRVPFIDPIVADMGLALPASAKLGDLSKLVRPETGTYAETGAKRILVDIGLRRKLVPPGMDRQPKRGFSMPFDSWMRKELRPFLEDTLSKESIQARGWFDPGEVAAVRASFQSGKVGWAQPWLLMMTELWARTVLDKAL